MSTLKSAHTLDVCWTGFRFWDFWWYNGLLNTASSWFRISRFHDSLLDTADRRFRAHWFHNRGFHNTGCRFCVLCFLHGCRNTAGCWCCAIRFSNSSLNTAGSRKLIFRKFCSHRGWRRTRSNDWARRSRRNSNGCYENKRYLTTLKKQSPQKCYKIGRTRHTSSVSCFRVCILQLCSKIRKKYVSYPVSGIKSGWIMRSLKNLFTWYLGGFVSPPNICSSMPVCWPSLQLEDPHYTHGP